MCINQPRLEVNMYINQPRECIYYVNTYQPCIQVRHFSPALSWRYSKTAPSFHDQTRIKELFHIMKTSRTQ